GERARLVVDRVEGGDEVVGVGGSGAIEVAQVPGQVLDVAQTARVRARARVGDRLLGQVDAGETAARIQLGQAQQNASAPAARVEHPDTAREAFAQARHQRQDVGLE